MDPKDCLAFEDAPLGIEAAKKAGMSCILVSESHELKALS
ncbi:MAG: HAD-IA family hydrolase [Pseudobdellovibrionaceae bacterium]